MPIPDKQIRIIKPDDWHLHLRDNNILKSAIPWTARAFQRAIIMPNLSPPITDVAACDAYRKRIKAVAPPEFEPLMTLYLSAEMPPDTIRQAKQSGFIYAVKMYPKNTTTHSAGGVEVENIERIFPLLEEMQNHDMPFLIHGEHPARDIDVFDREKIFIDKVLTPIRRRFDKLRIVLEHITTRDAVDYVSENNSKTAATITPHHLLYSRNALFDGGLRPHHYCLPLPQREPHRKALVKAATGGQSCFFAGTDSAPHHRHEKESACGCAGVFNAPAALAIYASIFAAADKLEHLEAFVSLHGAAFYGLEPNKQHITLAREEELIATSIDSGDVALIPFLAGQTVQWRIYNDGETA